MDRKIAVSVDELGDMESLGRMWLDIQTRAHHSFFQSWTWIDCWLRSLPRASWPKILTAVRENKVVGLGLFSERVIRRRMVIKSRAWFLHETGDPDYDVLTVEYNGILADRSCEEAVLTAILRHLVSYENWDEVILSGIDPASLLLRASVLERLGLNVHLLARTHSRHVDIGDLDDNGVDYLSALSSNTRYQLRRAMREYEKRGPLRVIDAGDLEQALAFFDEMKKLHQRYWTGKGQPGAFGNPFFEKFHRCLVAKGISTKEVQLLRISAGTTDVGYLYNFVKDGVVYNYQSGFCYEDNPKLRPGIISHYCAIDYNRQRGATHYDFLAGDSQYKKSLGKAERELVWAAIQRDQLMLRAEHLVRRIKNTFGGRILGAGGPSR